MTSDQTHVIVGASLTGAKAAETLRAGGLRRARRAHRRRGRAPLRAPAAVEGLPARRGRAREGLRPRRGLLRRARHRAAARAARRSSLNTSSSEVTLDDGERLRYDRLLLATGAEPRRLAIPGGELDGVLYLRSVEDSDALRERLDRGGAVVVVGAGWIGAEVAASARQRGLEVTVIDRPRSRSSACWAPRWAPIYRDIHTDHGARMLLGTGVEAFEGDDGGRARPHQRRARARLRLRRRRRRRRAAHRARGAGRLAVDNGILVDEHLQHQRTRRVCRRRRRQRPPPLLRRADPRRALGQRAQPGPGGRPQHARPTDALRPPALLLLRPVRRRHGVLGLRPRLGPGRLPRRPREPRVHRLLARARIASSQA